MVAWSDSNDFMKRDYVDFSEVPLHQMAIHGRLENWSISCFGRSGSNTSPMFRLYRSDEVWDPSPPSIPVDSADAAKIARAVSALPRPHMLAVNWYYVTRGAPIHGRRSIGCTLAELARYVIDGRQMLINRKV